MGRKVVQHDGKPGRYIQTWTIEIQHMYTNDPNDPEIEYSVGPVMEKKDIERYIMDMASEGNFLLLKEELIPCKTGTWDEEEE